jgi:hypothetical protein
MVTPTELELNEPANATEPPAPAVTGSRADPDDGRGDGDPSPLVWFDDEWPPQFGAARLGVP